MAIVVEKTIKMSEISIIKYQLLTYRFINSIKLSDSEIDCLLLLILNGECDLSEFSYAASAATNSKDKEETIRYSNPIFKTPQTVRNFLTRAQREKLIIKTGISKKKIKVNPELNIHSGQTMMLNFKMIYVAPKTT